MGLEPTTAWTTTTETEAIAWNAVETIVSDAIPDAGVGDAELPERLREAGLKGSDESLLRLLERLETADKILRDEEQWYRVAGEEPG
jgi:hypothetical protein